ncbi:calcium-binding protein [Rhizobium leguminosarum]|uniref:calcium-binding protein n=1 Tax=Rhizobium leguminosarum TaxID=384 RepID=UPI001F29494A|nr:calcium-binding protein [Rhizobium leguminosarum]UIJ81773.1 hypothetical protein LZK78_11030 [Rhizobium leguminosarum]
MTALSQIQIDTLNAITDGGTGHYWEGYTYLISILESDPASSDLLYWLTKATEINSNSYDSEANAFIRGVTRNGFLFSGASSFDIQGNSNIIGAAVIGGILSAGETPTVQSLIEFDVATAIGDGGQSIGGWGGAFYYWDLELQSGQTVGETILADKVEYDKFIAANAKAAADVMTKFGLTWEQFASALNAQVPSDVQLAIVTRIADVAVGDAPSFAGDPENIDGYHPVYGENDVVVGWTYNTAEQIDIPVTDSDLIAELNLRYGYRARLSDDPAFASANPDAGLHVTGGLQAMRSDTHVLNSAAANSPSSFVGSSVGQAALANLSTWYAERLAFTELSGTVVDGSSVGVLKLQEGAFNPLEVSFSGDLETAIDHEGNNSAGKPTTLTDAQKLEPRLFALDAVYGALAPTTNPSADMKATLDGAIAKVWASESDPSQTAAEKLQYYAFEASNGAAAILNAHSSDSSALIGGNGADTLNGGIADDILIARNGNDGVSGGEGSDIIFAGDGDDILSGGSGKDYLAGGEGADIIGGSELDVIDLSYYHSTWNDYDRDVISGGAGDDIIFSASDTWVLPEEFFGDRVKAAIESVDLVDGSDDGFTAHFQIDNKMGEGELGGTFTLTASALASASLVDGQYDLGTVTLDVWEGEDPADYAVWGQVIDDPTMGKTLLIMTSDGYRHWAVLGGVYNVESVLAGLDAASVTHIGTDGNDEQSGGTGYDAHNGGAGDDLFFASAGGDFYDGGDGVDTVDFSATSASLQISLTDDADLGGGVFISGGTATSDDVGEAWVSSVENIIGGAGADIVVGDLNDNSIEGRGGIDRLYGRSGNDMLTGGLGDDYLEGGIGNDTYKFNFGDGHDTIYDKGTASTDIDVLALGSGIAASDITVTKAANGSDLLLTVGGGGDTIVLKGQLTNNAGGVDQIAFVDGTTWDRTTIKNHIAA